MTGDLPRAWGGAAGAALIRCVPEDFCVTEELGFEPDGDGEHAFLYLEKRCLNTLDLEQQLAVLCDVPRRDVGYSGLKDNYAVTRQWFSVGLAGKPEPDWTVLEADGDVRVLAVERHRRKLRRGVHRRNRFTLVLRELEAERPALESRLVELREGGFPNYFGEQRFGRGGANLGKALDWTRRQRRVSRSRRSLYLSVLRSHLFNQLLATRVAGGDWNVPRAGDTCMLQGSRSFFVCGGAGDDDSAVDELSEILARAVQGDLHPGVPLWGKGLPPEVSSRWLQGLTGVENSSEITAFLQRSGPDFAWRAARALPDDFCWQFCDDGHLQLDFALDAGCYATALLAEFVHYKEGRVESGIGSELG